MFTRATDMQSSILLGTVLGDGSINKCGGITTAASHKHRDYLEWKHDALASLLPSQIRTSSRYDDRYGRMYTTCRFYLGKVGKVARDVFYPGHEKIIPNVTLSKIAVAVWILDDGNLVSRCSFSIATNGFATDSVKRGCVLLQSIGVECHPDKHKERILIPTSSARVVRNWLVPIVEHVPSMAHKIDFRAPAYVNPPAPIVCGHCGKTFTAYKSDKRIACSTKCGRMLRRNGYDTRTRTKACSRCGAEFVIYNHRQTKCKDCRGKRTKDVPCAVCGNPVSAIGRMTCSTSCGVAYGHRQRRK